MIIVSIVGESFRNSGKGSRGVGAPSSITPQLAAADTHMRFCDELSKNTTVRIVLCTVLTPHTPKLLEKYKRFLYRFIELSSPQGQRHSMSHIVRVAKECRPEGIFRLRVDMHLKDAFDCIASVLPSPLVLFMSICWINDHLSYKIGQEPNFSPRVNDVALWVPIQVADFVTERQGIGDGHGLWNALKENLECSTMVSELFDSNTARDRNPYYCLCSRPENHTMISEGYIYDATRQEIMFNGVTHTHFYALRPWIHPFKVRPYCEKKYDEQNNMLVLFPPVWNQFWEFINNYVTPLARFVQAGETHFRHRPFKQHSRELICASFPTATHSFDVTATEEHDQKHKETFWRKFHNLQGASVNKFSRQFAKNSAELKGRVLLVQRGTQTNPRKRGFKDAEATRQSIQDALGIPVDVESLETHTLAKQAETIHSYKYIIVTHGAAMSYIRLFHREGAIVYHLATPFAPLHADHPKPHAQRDWALGYNNQGLTVRNIECMLYDMTLRRDDRPSKYSDCLPVNQSLMEYYDVPAQVGRS